MHLVTTHGIVPQTAVNSLMLWVLSANSMANIHKQNLKAKLGGLQPQLPFEPLALSQAVAGAGGNNKGLSPGNNINHNNNQNTSGGGIVTTVSSPMAGLVGQKIDLNSK